MPVLLAVAAIAFVLAACGVPEDDAPKALAVENVPFDLLAPNAAGGLPGPGEGIQASIYLVDGEDRLVDVQRRVPYPAALTERLSSLLQPATLAENNAGLRNTIPDSTQLNSVSEPVDGVVNVDLTGPLAAGAGQRLALAQIVFTATAVRRPVVTGVLFYFDGVFQEVPDSTGAQSAAPRTRDDYREMLAPPG